MKPEVPLGYKDNEKNCKCCLTCKNSETGYDFGDIECSMYCTYVSLLFICDKYEMILNG
jgi:hypothetical protein